METKIDQAGLTVEIEELEAKIAPDGGETVLPITTSPHHLRH
jgi:hypothetical protein